MSPKNEDSKGAPIAIVALALIGFVAAFFWAFAAAAYAHSEEGWRKGGVEAAAEGGGRMSIRGTARRSFWDFVVNAFRQIPRFGAVMRHTFENRWWLVGLFVAMEGAIIFGAWQARRIEQEWSGPHRKSRRPRPRP